MTLYTSRQLAELVRPLDRPQQFLQSVFFPSARLFETRKIDFAVLNMAREVAQFVHPDSTARAVAERGSKIDSFEPAYIKQLTPITPQTALDLMPGETYGGDRSPQERVADRIAQIIVDHEAAIARREEVMCSTILATGAITVTGDEYPTATVSFGRAAGQTVALTSTARWGETGVSPQANIRTWVNLVSSSAGAAVDTAVLGDEAWELLLAESAFRERLDNRRQMSGEIEMLTVAKGEDAWGVYQGRVGNIDYWTYSQPYTEAGTAKNVMHPHGVILGSKRQLGGVMGYGAILDMDALIAAKFWSQNYDTKNPSRRWIESAAAPLPIPTRVNASFYAQVR